MRLADIWLFRIKELEKELADETKTKADKLELRQKLDELKQQTKTKKLSRHTYLLPLF